MRLLGKLLSRFRAGGHRSPLAGPEYAGASTIDVTSSVFADGGTIPQKHAGKGVGDNVSPALQWTGVPADAKQLVLIMDDLDVPMPKPLMHTIAVIEPDVGGLGEAELKPGTTGVRLIKAFGDTYVGPRPIPGNWAAPLSIPCFGTRPKGPRRRRRPRGLAFCHRRPRARARHTDRHVRALRSAGALAPFSALMPLQGLIFAADCRRIVAVVIHCRCCVFRC